MPSAPYDAIVLAGGHGSRAGSVDKLSLMRDGRTVLSYAIAAVPAAGVVAIVGPAEPGHHADRRIVSCREDPTFGGPVAAIGAALPYIVEDVVVVIAGDQPNAAAAVPTLVAGLAGDGAVVVDASGIRQPLLAAYRRQWLIARVAAAGTGASMTSLLVGADLAEIPDLWLAAADIDTLADAARLGFSYEGLSTPIEN